MIPQFVNGNVRANCPDCGGAVTTFEYKQNNGHEYGTVALHEMHLFNDMQCQVTIFKLLRCAGCGRGGLVESHVRPNHNYEVSLLGQFYPATIDRLQIPQSVPEGIESEFQEAEICASVRGWRAASAMLRSTLEKTLRANGYTNGSLAQRIDEAATDGVITAARSRRAHEDIRVLGNDVLHDEWRAVTADEFDQAHHYAQRILEDLYDDRASVEALLKEKGRMA